MKTEIFLDNNIFDLLYDKNINLLSELSPIEYSFHIIKEINYEIEPIPHKEKKLFIQNLVNNHISIESYFGFYNNDHPSNMQRCGGFNEGKFFSLSRNKKELDFLNKHKSYISQTLKNSGLYHNETDLALAAKSFNDNQYVITLNVNGGPLKKAYEEGGKVILLYKDDKNRINKEISFGELIKERINTFKCNL